MAKPRPMEPDWLPCAPPSEAMAELMPTSSPFMFTRAPPELPGLIAASVWMASMTDAWLVEELSPEALTGRFRALMMPEVTVPARPRGEPMATTFWPTATVLELPMAMGVRPVLLATLMTAMSAEGSRPTMLAVAVLPSWKTTLMAPVGALAAA